MSSALVKSPMQYLDSATGALRKMGLMPTKMEDAPITGLLQKISDLDPDRIAVITRTLGQTSVFNEVVREQISGIQIGDRYKQITEGFNSIRDDAKSLVDQYADGKISTMERIGNVWMKMTRGDIAARFDKIRKTYLDVAGETRNQVERETRILEAYRDFRGALKQSEVLALDVLKNAEGKLADAKAAHRDIADFVATISAGDRRKLSLS